MSTRGGLGRPILLVLLGIASVQVGAAIAKNLFDQVSPTGLVWLRLTAAAVILLVVARPRLTGRSRRDWWVLAGYAVALAGMNWSIYQAFHLLPLGVAVTIEFLGPLAVAVATSRRVADIGWAVLAAAGVALLGFSPTDLSWAGIGFALLAGLCWAGYILLSPTLGKHWQGVDGLAVASALAAVVLAPAAIVSDGRQLVQPMVLGMGVAIGVLSSVIPYSLDLAALRTLPRRVFSVLMSLEPAAAALAALLILGERLSAVDVAAMVCVVTASIGITRSATRVTVTEVG